MRHLQYFSRFAPGQLELDATGPQIGLKELLERLISFAVYRLVRHPIQREAKRFQDRCLPGTAPADHAVEAVAEVHLDRCRNPPVTSRERIRWCLEEGLVDAVIAAHLLQRRSVDGASTHTACSCPCLIPGNLSNPGHTLAGRRPSGRRSGRGLRPRSTRPTNHPAVRIETGLSEDAAAAARHNVGRIGHWHGAIIGTSPTAQTPATRHVPRGPQISCHAVNSAGLIG